MPDLLYVHTPGRIALVYVSGIAGRPTLSRWCSSTHGHRLTGPQPFVYWASLGRFLEGIKSARKFGGSRTG